jgi:uncharacterized protein CbrC (UPF0167 family)
MDLPIFRYHPDPIRSGSIAQSDAQCQCCGKERGYIYEGPVYAEEDLEDSICPWCIANSSAHKKFKAEFVDTEAFPDGMPKAAITEISQSTPGYSAWQSEAWPSCCEDATAFLRPTGIQEIRKECYEVEGHLMTYVVQELHISGGAAKRLVESLSKDSQPTLYLFQCLHCQRYRFHIDGT